jgi:hypothetical protein
MMLLEADHRMRDVRFLQRPACRKFARLQRAGLRSNSANAPNSRPVGASA